MGRDTLGQQTISNMNLEIHVTYLPNTETKLPTTAPLMKAVLSREPRHFAQRDKIRSAKTEEEQKLLKRKSTTCMVVAGQIDWAPKADGTDEKVMVSFSGFGQIDIDGLSQYGFTPSQVRDELAKLYFVVYAGISTRGDGVWLLINLDCTDLDSYTSQWTAAHEFVYSLLDKAAGQKVKRDSKGKNPTDFRFVCPDEEGRFNPEAKPFGVKKENKPVYVAKPISSNSNRLIQLLELIADKRVDLTSKYEDWRNLGFSLAATLGESGREWFHALSQFHPKYKPAEADKQYNESLKRNGYNFTEDFLFALARNHGIILKECVGLPTDKTDKSPVILQSIPRIEPTGLTNPGHIEAFEAESKPVVPMVETGRVERFIIKSTGEQIDIVLNEHGYPADWDLPMTIEEIVPTPLTHAA
ncbi:PriCT-2 domain-containing protein [Xanthocytophaga agilis]|uniref:PriCT-2 domain-containing protein n=1 Tax=Xanthocytophaga agilis TaxID=3048010 RepID=A0AAE3R161_9BACT|nr:PriCT-2 domain-containing protein [Xanthocytophaga agilis]MDJ1501824.1 PriCT-2 domain-containing protein [Xanthocytophaga agilis]